MLLAIIIIGMNSVLYFGSSNEPLSKEYLVQISRIVKQLKITNIGQVDLNQYDTMISVYPLTQENEERFYENAEHHYVIRQVNDIPYRFNYKLQSEENKRKYFYLMNGSFILLAILIVVVIISVRQSILKPFNKIMNLPYELSKGNLSLPLQENKGKIFGKFIWGLDLLREELEETKQKELALQKEKKTLVLSISHDINTPLSAIKLYAKALSKNLYDTKEKQHEIAENINSKADEIDTFVSEIIKASNEEFLKLEVQNDSFYLKNLLDQINSYYIEKLRLLKIPFLIGTYENFLLYGDCNRSVEVLQNIIENAIKYGSGEYISLTMEIEENCMIVSIKNSGCTLDSNEVSNIFDSFWRGSNVGIIKGSGLGLYICKELMTKMGGSIYGKIEEKQMEVAIVFRKI